jgi:CheY-like chemotaxis protein
MPDEVRHTRVLVVEDEPVFRIPLCAVLRAGFDVCSVESAEAAEDLLVKSKSTSSSATSDFPGWTAPPWRRAIPTLRSY